MPQELHHDSTLDFNFSPLPTRGELQDELAPTPMDDASQNGQQMPAGVASWGTPVDVDVAAGDFSADPLPVFDLQSSEPLPEISPPGGQSHLGFGEEIAPPKGYDPAAGRQAAARKAKSSWRGESAEKTPGGLWLQGDVIMCGCPDCHAPMSVRLWLMIADCWNCGASIELTEEQEREAQRLYQQQQREARQRESTRRPQPKPSRAAAGAAPSSKTAASQKTKPRPQKENPADRGRRGRPAGAPATREAQRDKSDPQKQPQRKKTRSKTTPPPPPGARRKSQAPRRRKADLTRRYGRRSKKHPLLLWLRGLLKNTPAWLLSSVIHLVVLTILALLTFSSYKNREIVLSTVVDNDRAGGGESRIIKAEEQRFDLPVPADVDMSDPKTRDAMVRADQDARELRLDASSSNPNLPDLSRVRKRIKAARTGSKSPGTAATFAARDPRVRVEMVTFEGGTTETEAAVSRGLKWMSEHQNRDGSWSLNRFHNRPGMPRCDCGGHGSTNSDAAGTSLVLLPFLGAGQSHLVGKYKDQVSGGLRWLVKNQEDSGFLASGSSGNTKMYAHGQATIVLCEAFAMTGDEQLRAPAQKAVNFIVESQYSDGGWRYNPKQGSDRGDTSVVGWQLMALQSAKTANLTVPDETMEFAGAFLDSVSSDGGSRYGYQRGQKATPAMTAEGLLCRMYLGWDRSEPGLIQGSSYLARNLPTVEDPNFYYWYYGTQTMHHIGGPNWDNWNLRMRRILVDMQEKEGHAAGSWTPRDKHDRSGGRIYTTALATCMLEVYYRHLPLFKQIDLSER